VQVEAVQVRLPWPARQHALRVGLVPDPPHPPPGARPQRHPPLHRENRPHQGRWCYGKTPKQTFLDTVPVAKEKLLVA
jgi:hypothetical protein